MVNARAKEVELVRATVVDTERADRFIRLLSERDKTTKTTSMTNALGQKGRRQHKCCGGLQYCAHYATQAGLVTATC